MKQLTESIKKGICTRCRINYANCGGWCMACHYYYKTGSKEWKAYGNFKGKG